MNRPCLAWSLRVTWTAVCGAAVVLMSALWARSYWRADVAGYSRPSTSFTISSQNGALTISKLYEPNGSFIGSRAVEDPVDGKELLSVNWWDERPQRVSLVFPHWLAALPFGSAVRWRGFRGDLRSEV